MTEVYHVGVSGTRHGAKVLQLATFRELLLGYPASTVLHHGDCVGFDEQAHNVALEEDFDIEIHPPDNSTNRAYCECAIRVHPEEPYMVRNQHIVDAADILIAAPSGAKEQSRGGTWSAVRMARKKGIPICIIWYSGKVTYENKGE